MTMANFIEASRMHFPSAIDGFRRLATLVPSIRLDDTPNIFAQAGLTCGLILFTLVFAGIVTWGMISAAKNGMFDHLHEPQRAPHRDRRDI